MKKSKFNFIFILMFMFFLVSTVSAEVPIDAVEKIDTDQVLLKNDNFEWVISDEDKLDTMVLGATLLKEENGGFYRKQGIGGTYYVSTIPETSIKTDSNPNTTVLTAIYRNAAKINGEFVDCKVEMFDFNSDNNNLLSGMRWGFHPKELKFILIGEFDNNHPNPDFPDHIRAKLRLSFYKAGTYQVTQGPNDEFATIVEGEKISATGARIAVGGWNSELTDAETGQNNGIQTRQTEWLSVDNLTGSDVTKAYTSNQVLIEYIKRTGLHYVGDNTERTIFTNNDKRIMELVDLPVNNKNFIRYGCYFLEVGPSGDLLFEFGKTVGSIELMMLPVSLPELPVLPTKTVEEGNNSGVYPEDTLTYNIKQQVNKRNKVQGDLITEFGNSSDTFTYDALNFKDTLPEEVEYLEEINRTQEFGVFDDAGNKLGDFTYDAGTHTISYDFPQEYLKNTMKYEGETYTFRFKVKVKTEYTETDQVVKNKATVRFNNQYDIETNETQNPIIKKSKLVILHVEKGTDTTNPEQITDVLYPIETKEGRVDSEYTTSDREEEININSPKYKYKLVKTPENANGKFSEETTYVIYEYEKVKGNVHVKHLEEGTDREIAEDEDIPGYVGEDYTTYPKDDIPNYEYVEEKAPENAKGQMQEGTIEVVYYYRRSEIAIPDTGDIAVYSILVIALLSLAGIFYVLKKKKYNNE